MQETTCTGFEAMMSEDQMREALEGNLVPKGVWKGQLQPVEPEDTEIVVTEDGQHPLEGKPVTTCHVVLYTDEGEKHFFFRATPFVVKATAKSGGTYMREESINAAHLYKAVNGAGKKWEDVLREASNRILLYDIGVRKASVDFPARNTLRKITASIED